MTIEYASPEQIRGDPVGPRSDVYSLGVLLFELLTKRRPYRTEGRMMHSLALAICEEPPMSPSSALNDRRLSGDLDSILLKALRKEPNGATLRRRNSATTSHVTSPDRVSWRATTPSGTVWRESFAASSCPQPACSIRRA